MSTEIVLWISFSKAISPLIASQFPSKAVPTISPQALITGEPEFPPVISFFEIGVRLGSEECVLSPSLDDVQNCINRSAQAVLGCFKRVKDWRIVDGDMVILRYEAK